MTRRPNPIEDAGLRDKDTRAPSARWRFAVYALRGYEFLSHPYFTQAPHLLFPSSAQVVFESLLYRARPILLTVSDDSSIWSTLQSFREVETRPNEEIKVLEDRYRSWLSLSQEELRPHWPNWEVEEPQCRFLEDGEMGESTPIEQLWDVAFGSGPHSDYRRLLRTRIVDWSPEGRQFQNARFNKLLATMAAARPLVHEIHEIVCGELEEGKGPPEQTSISLLR